MTPDVKKYTKFVKLSKRSLIVVISIMIFGLIILPIINNDKEGARIAFSSDTELPDEKPIMKNPRFQGFDKEMQPYLITAEYALQKGADEIVLHKVKGDLSIDEDKNWIIVSADSGTLQVKKKTLSLEGNIKIFHDGGYEFSTEKINILMSEGMAHTLSPAEGRSPFGRITSQRFSVYDKGQRLVFDGGVNMKINASNIRNKK